MPERDWELRVHDAGTFTPTDLTVSFTIPRGRLVGPPPYGGAVIKPLEGRANLLAYSVAVVDDDGWLTALLFSGGLPVIVGRLAEVRVAVDGGGFQTVDVRRISAVRGSSRPEYELELSNERWIGRQDTLFRENRTLQLVPQMPSVPWFVLEGGTLTDPLDSREPGRVLSVIDEFLLIQSGGFRIDPEFKAAALDADVIDDPRPRNVGGNFRGLRFEDEDGIQRPVVAFKTLDAATAEDVLGGEWVVSPEGTPPIMPDFWIRWPGHSFVIGNNVGPWRLWWPDGLPTTPETPHLIGRSSEPNLIANPEAFNLSPWSGSATVTADNASAPNGSVTAEKVEDTSGSVVQNLAQGSIPYTAGDPVVGSLHIRKQTSPPQQRMTIAFVGGTTDRFARLVFDAETGAFASVGDTGLVVEDAGVVDVSTDWWRIFLIARSTEDHTEIALGGNPAHRPSPDLSFTDDGSATGFHHWWGAQLVLDDVLPPYPATSYPLADFLRDLYDGVYGGDALRFDGAAVAAIRDIGHAGGNWWVITAPADREEFLAQIYRANFIVPLEGPDGTLAPRQYVPESLNAHDLYRFDASTVIARPSYEAAGRELRNVFRLSYLQAATFSQHFASPLRSVRRSQVTSTDRVYSGASELAAPYELAREQILTPTAASDVLAALPDPLFDLVGGGAQVWTVRGHATDDAPRPGDPVILDTGALRLPEAGSASRGGVRACVVIERQRVYTADEVYYDYRLWDLGVSLQQPVAHADQDVHSDSHGDAAHLDVPHDDAAHSDASHSDSHSDSAHVDDHTDTHGDAAHTDHDDVIHTDHQDGIDPIEDHDDHDDSSHADIPHNDSHTDTHSDTPHGDSHTDTSHADSPHSDSAHGDGAHDDTHGDAAHVDVPHGDLPHGDAHDDLVHGDGHGDTAHSDSAHSDEPHQDHDDAYSDVPHEDEPHGDEGDEPPAPHTDTPHGDTAHADHGDATTHLDTAHGDAAHGDGGHADTAHADYPLSTGHDDVAHVDIAHDDQHSDTPHNDVF